MYSAHGTYYTEEHSVSFGEIVTVSSGGMNYHEFVDMTILMCMRL